MVAEYYNTYYDDIFRNPFFIGFSNHIKKMHEVQNKAQYEAYPPYDIVKIDEDNYSIVMAIAGFSKEDVNITLEDGVITVAGEIQSNESHTLIHKGIAKRKFTRTFALAEYIEIVGAEMKDGILTIKLERIVPEEKKPKQITIS